MKKDIKKDEEDIIKIFNKEKQEHLFYFWNELDEKEKDSLTKELLSVNLNEINSYYKKFKNHKNKKINFKETDCFSIFQSSEKEKIKKIGIEMLSANKVAVLTVAGGQGSRLGYEHPKGFFRNFPCHEKVFISDIC